MNAVHQTLIDRAVNTIRFLSVDAVQKANSGHPGLPLGAAPMAYALWMRHLRHNPRNPRWPDRDRFVLSAGHGSMLLYSLLHLTGYDLSLEDIKAFRQWESKTPGHPEYGVTPGVEMTAGPLGQGISTAVGMACAEAHLAARFNRDDSVVVDHYTYVLASDGDLMEGVAAEACSLAGHLGLGKLIVLYDDNRITLAGATSLTFTEDVGRRFEAYGWQALRVDDGADVRALDDAIAAAKQERSKPSLIMVRTILGYGSPKKQNTFAAHGSPLGADEAIAAKKNLQWPVEPAFWIPEDVHAHFLTSRDRGNRWEAEWQESFEKYRQRYTADATELERVTGGVLPEGWDLDLPDFTEGGAALSTRKASETILQTLAPRLPELMGGTADLNTSTLGWLKGFGDFQPPDRPVSDRQGAVGGPWNFTGRNIHFGVREHAMAAIASGMTLHGGIIPFTGTFLTFSDYMRPAMRLAALMGLRVVYIFSHDSIGVGEDGPTHQPVEQVMGMRTTPNLTVFRPGDAAETVEAWRAAVKNDHGPTALVLTRQDVPRIDRTRCASASGATHGGYLLWESQSQDLPEIIIIATGAEVHLALTAAENLVADGSAVRVVSMPSWDLFDSQPPEYRTSVLPPAVTRRIAVEAGITLGWEHYVGIEGKVIGMKGFGASAPAPVLYRKFGITVEAIVETARELLGKK
ncbi:MAG: transketolase [Deltaproteobacteria bacterium]|nr:transketolase [Deltaproteobacteria bacterium]